MATRVSQFRKVGPALVEHRQAPRLRLSMKQATVRKLGAEPGEATLHDLSIYGCRVAADSEQPAGERLWLRFEGGMPIAATVVWSKDGFVGCRFDEPIQHSLMRSLTLSIC